MSPQQQNQVKNIKPCIISLFIQSHLGSQIHIRFKRYKNKTKSKTTKTILALFAYVTLSEVITTSMASPLAISIFFNYVDFSKNSIYQLLSGLVFSYQN